MFDILNMENIELNLLPQLPENIIPLIANNETDNCSFLQILENIIKKPENNIEEIVESDEKEKDKSKEIPKKEKRINSVIENKEILINNLCNYTKPEFKEKEKNEYVPYKTKEKIETLIRKMDAKIISKTYVVEEKIEKGLDKKEKELREEIIRISGTEEDMCDIKEKEYDKKEIIVNKTSYENKQINIIEQITKYVKTNYTKLNIGRKVEIKLNPESLGKVNVEVVKERGEIEIKFSAEEKEVERMMTKEIYKLEENFKTIFPKEVTIKIAFIEYKKEEKERKEKQNDKFYNKRKQLSNK